MASYRLTDDAQRDLDAILEYIAINASVERAMNMFERVRNGMRRVAEMPGMGHFREDLLDQRFKFWSVDPYVIVYRWQMDPIKVIAIIHGARDLAAFLADRKS
jgi:antitoxin ParD1/3/4/toxin ParE1/3/4